MPVQKLGKKFCAQDLLELKHKPVLHRRWPCRVPSSDLTKNQSCRLHLGNEINANLISLEGLSKDLFGEPEAQFKGRTLT